MADNQSLHYTRGKLIDFVCNLSSMFVMTIFIVDNTNLSWWRYLIGVAAWVVLNSIYAIVFKRLILPKEKDTTEISTTKKYLCYLMTFVLVLISITLFSVLPFEFGFNLAISIIVNFILTMGFCYYIAKP